ncbi:MAG: PIN domain-containing protein [Thermoleophilia bacterium]
MARLIFDSSVLVAGHRGEGLSGLVAEHEEDVAIAAVTVAELRMGAHRGHATRAEQRGRWLDGLLTFLDVEPYDLRVAEVHARLLAQMADAGAPKGAHDLIIAATAIATDRVLVTFDHRSVDGIAGLRVRTAPVR